MSSLSEPVVVKLAKRDNYVYSGWHLDDYARFEIEVQGSMTCIIWGSKGSLKSSFLLSRGYAIYKDWDRVLEHIVVEPPEFIKLIKRSREEKIRIPWIGWDDINAHLPRTLYFTSRSLYQSMKRNWDLLRPAFSVFMCSCVRKTDVISFILGDMDTEVVASKRKAEKAEDGSFKIAREVNLQVRRWVAYHNPYGRMRVNEESILIDGPLTYAMEEVPADVFKKYWTKRLKVTDQGIEDMARSMEELVAKYEGAPKKEEPPSTEAYGDAERFAGA